MIRDRERLIVFRTSDLPAELSSVLPQGAGPHGCLFWVARSDGEALARLMEVLPEPDIDHVAEGMQLAKQVAEVLGRSRRLADLLRPEDVEALGPQFFGTYSMGFHTAPADVALPALQATGAELVPISGVLSRVAVLLVRDASGEPLHDVLLHRWVRDDALGFRRVDPIAPGLFAVEVPEVPMYAEWLFGAGEGVEVPPLRGGEVQHLTLAPEELHERRPRGGRWSEAEIGTLVDLVREIHAHPVEIATAEGLAQLAIRASTEHGGTLELELLVDGDLRKTTTSPFPGRPEGISFDVPRVRALTRGARQALGPEVDLETLLPEDFFPFELLIDAELSAESDFEAVAFDLAPIARVRGPVEVSAFLAGRGLAPVSDDVAVKLWCALPDALLERRFLSSGPSLAHAGATWLGEHAPELLEVAIEAWLERAVADGSTAFGYLPLFDEVMAAMRQAAGPERASAAARRFGERQRDHLGRGPWRADHLRGIRS